MLETSHTAEIRRLDPYILRSMLIATKKLKHEFSRNFMLAVNTALYEDRRGGQYADLIDDEEFMLALDWHNTHHDI